MSEKNFSLYELTEKEKQLKQLAATAVTEEDEQMFRDTFESIDLAIEDKIGGCCKVLSDLDGAVKMFKEEEARLATRRKTIENNIKNLKEYMMTNMKKVDINDISIGTHKIAIVKKGGKRKMNILVDTEELPEEFIVTKREPNKNKIYDMFKKLGGIGNNNILRFNGKEIAELEPQGEYLSIR